MTGGSHPDFEKAAPEARWTGKLADLGETLRKEAWGSKGEWTWRILPHGALVAMRVNPETFRKELRIARSAGLKNEAAANKWVAEIRTFQKILKIEDWAVADMVGQPGGAGPIHCLLREATPLGGPLRGEPPEREKCIHCGEPADKGTFKDAVCTACATRLGQEEADANNAARAHPTQVGCRYCGEVGRVSVPIKHKPNCPVVTGAQ